MPVSRLAAKKGGEDPDDDFLVRVEPCVSVRQHHHAGGDVRKQRHGRRKTEDTAAAGQLDGLLAVLRPAPALLFEFGGCAARSSSTPQSPPAFGRTGRGPPACSDDLGNLAEDHLVPGSLAGGGHGLLQAIEIGPVRRAASTVRQVPAI